MFTKAGSANGVIVNAQRVLSSQFCFNMAEETIWSFGYGSNMDVKALEAKKHVKVIGNIVLIVVLPPFQKYKIFKIIEHTPAILKDFKMTFSLRGAHHTEPYYSGLTAQEGAEVHGVAFCMDMESAANLDKNESGGYKKQMVTLKSYDGRDLHGFIYMNRTPPQGDFQPSARYLGVLVKGAKQAGLDSKYIEQLSKRPVYQPDEVTLQARQERPHPDSLKEITVEELSKHKEDPDAWVACLGYVLPAKPYFRAHRGRDITTRVLMQFHGIPMDDNDDAGRPPYPILDKMSKDEVEYVTRWLDHYELSADGSSKTAFLGYVKEFKEQQKTGTTSFKLPPIP